MGGGWGSQLLAAARRSQSRAEWGGNPQRKTTLRALACSASGLAVAGCGSALSVMRGMGRQPPAQHGFGGARPLRLHVQSCRRTGEEPLIV